jgi:2-phosphosulfolactate phosphatase
MSKHCNVYLLPALASPAEFQGTTAIVIDVLRATTTIIYALAAGATKVIPVLTVEEARNKADGLKPRPLLGGERGGECIEGFDLGNSPTEYTRERLSGKTLVVTTTNGTRAMQHARHASRLLLGAFVNFGAICRELQGASEVSILCAGTDGQITREDTLLAGAIADDLMRSTCAAETVFNDQAEIAADAWRALLREIEEGKPLTAHLRSSQGARNLIELGMERDIDIAAEIDRFDLVPELDLTAWQIAPMSRIAGSG